MWQTHTHTHSLIDTHTLIYPIPLSSWIWWVAFGMTSRQRTRPCSAAPSPFPPLFLPPTEWIWKTGDLAVGLWGKWATSCHRQNRPFETWFVGFEWASDCGADNWKGCEGVPFIWQIKRQAWWKYVGTCIKHIVAGCLSSEHLYGKRKGQTVAVNPYAVAGKL